MARGQPLQVAVVSRHELTRAGLKALLANRPDLAVVIDTPSHDRHLGRQDVSIYDLAGLGNGGDFEHLIASERPVVALVPYDRPDMNEGALRAGAAAVVGPDITVCGLLQALEHATNGATPASPKRTVGQRQQRLMARCGLTAREAQVLQLIGTGRSNEQVAREMYLSINSIKSYIRTAYRKIGVRSRSQAVLWVWQMDSWSATDPGVPTGDGEERRPLHPVFGGAV